MIECLETYKVGFLPTNLQKWVKENKGMIADNESRGNELQRLTTLLSWLLMDKIVSLTNQMDTLRQHM